MNSSEIVDKFGIDRKTFKIGGQRMLIADDDLILRNIKWRTTDDKNFDQHAAAHWWMNVYAPMGRGDLGTPQEIFNSWSDTLYHVFKYTGSSGYNHTTNQSGVRISAVKNVPWGYHMDELMVWLPLIKPMNNSEEILDRPVDFQFKYVDIFESTLSEHGTYDLYVADSASFIIFTRFHSTEVLHTFEKLEDAVSCIIENYWYKESP